MSEIVVLPSILDRKRAKVKGLKKIIAERDDLTDKYRATLSKLEKEIAHAEEKNAQLPRADNSEADAKGCFQQNGHQEVSL